MGFFGTYLYAGEQWTEHDPEQAVEVAGAWLLIDIHDSDFTVVRYSPEYDGTGVAYLGYTPRMYFESEDDDSRTDTTREATALTTWWTNHTPTADPAAAGSKRAELLPYLAEDHDTFDLEDEDGEDDEDLPDSEIYVEVKTADFLASLDLPLPPALEQLLA
ncbi:hypothetical protein [Kribbella sp. NPDC051620]|uniref:hypothetical protein n=1 Tax=Kribbella sp. NPDC051620 TaxID=3364120 RepID=UPI0037AD7182